MIVRLFQFCMRLLVGEKGKDKFKVKFKGQGRLVFSKSPRKSRVRPFVCSKKTFSCYFWRSCGGQYPIAGAAKPASSTRAGSVCRAQHRGGGMCDRDCWKPPASAAQAISENSPSASCRTYTPTPPALFIPSLKFADRKNGAQLIRWQNLSVPHTPPIVIFLESTCSHRPCLPHKPSSRTTLL